MIRFTSALLARSTRWVAPAILAALWTSLAILPAGPETTVSRAGGMFFCYMIVGCWLTILTGNVDDDAHRELLTAVVGTRWRLHLYRAATAFLWTAAFGLAITVFSLLIHSHTHSVLTEAAGALGLTVSGALIGVALGTPLHRPIIRSQSTSLLLGLGLVIAVILLPPMQSVEKDASNNEIGHVPALLAIAIALALASTLASATAATHRRT
jgi:hypothetical protein